MGPGKLDDNSLGHGKWGDSSSADPSLLDLEKLSFFSTQDTKMWKIKVLLWPESCHWLGRSELWVTWDLMRSPFLGRALEIGFSPLITC